MQNAPELAELSELSEAEIQKKLAAGGAAGAKRFRGRKLAPYTDGLRDLILKIVSPQDTLRFHDVTMIHVLMEAHGETPAERLAKRQTLIHDSDDVDAFRAKVSVDLLDALSADEFSEVRRLVNEIIGPVRQAQVTVQAPTGAKKKGAAKAKPSPTTARS